jgi:enoyl-CoA hydratase/carnithine racemase
MSIEIEGQIAILGVASGTEPVVLSEKSLAVLAAEFRAAASHQSVTDIVLTSPKATFLTGADVRYFARCVLAGDLDRLLRFTEQGRRLFDEIQQCPKRVVAWVRGPAIGAGLELALACHRIVAGPQAKFSLPETGLGIYPGLGGTQRAPRRIGVGLAKWMIFTGAMVSPENAAQIGLIDAVCATGKSAAEAIAAANSPAATPSPSERFAALDRFFSTHTVATLCDPNLPLPADANLARAVVQVRSKSPVALRLAEAVIDGGAQLPLADALDLEFSHLREAFGSADARAGLLSLGTQRVEFAGQ